MEFVERWLGEVRLVFNKPNSSEFDYHVFWDLLIAIVLCRLSNACPFHMMSKRGRVGAHTFLSDPSESKFTTSRCDQTVVVKNVPLLRGEEKKLAAELRVAEKELVEKLHPNEATFWRPYWFCSLPFTFTYATGGPVITFHAMSPTLQLIPLFKELQMSIVEDQRKVC